MELKIAGLSNNEHAAQVAYLIAHPDHPIDYVHCVKEAYEYLLRLANAGLKVRDNPEYLVEWYNKQFGTSFTLEQMQALAQLQATTLGANQP